MQNFLNALWEFTGGKEIKENFIQKALKVCKVCKSEAFTSLMFHQRRQYTIFCFVKTFER